MNWFNLLILFGVFAGPAIIKALQTASEKKSSKNQMPSDIIETKRLAFKRKQSLSDRLNEMLTSSDTSTGSHSATGTESRKKLLAQRRAESLRQWKDKEQGLPRSTTRKRIQTSSSQTARPTRSATTQRATTRSTTTAKQSQSRASIAKRAVLAESEKSLQELRRESDSHHASHLRRVKDSPPTPDEQRAREPIHAHSFHSGLPDDLPTSMFASPRSDGSGPHIIIPGSAGLGHAPIILNRHSLRQAFILKELLEPPVALRDSHY